MTGRTGARRMALAWAAALALALAGVAGFAAWARHAYAAKFAGTDAVFVGSSLFRHAITWGGATPAALEPLAPRVIRYGAIAAAEAEILAIARLAAATDARRVFVEANRLVTRFAHMPEDCAPMQERLAFVARFQDYAIRSLDFGPPELPGLDWPPADTPFAVDEAWRDLAYPPAPRAPCLGEAWRALTDASPPGRIIWVLMPRSETAEAAIGAETHAALLQEAKDAAAAAGAPLLVVDPDGAWADAYFIDQSHMNRKGAARFAEWLVAQWPDLPPLGGDAAAAAAQARTGGGE